MFPFPIVPSVEPPAIITDAADFDGTNDYATRGAGLTGIADSKKFTLAFWIFPEDTTARRVFSSYTTVGGATYRFTVFRIATGQIQIIASNAAGTQILNCNTSAALTLSAWNCVLASFDLSDTGKRHLYIGDSNEYANLTYTDDTIDFTVADWAIGANADGTSKWNGGLAELLFWPGVYADISVEATRRLLFSASAKPVNPRSGAFSLLGRPAAYFHLNDGETANNFVTNDDGGATGGAFTVAGALSTYASSPSD